MSAAAPPLWGPIEGNWRVTVHNEDGHLWAEVLDMPGVFVSGDSMEELIESLTEAIGMFLSSNNVEVVVKDLVLVPDEEEKGTVPEGQYKLVPA